MSDGKWTVRKRAWPNGRVFFIVMKGATKVLVGPSGGESKYYCKSQAQSVADGMNNEASKADDFQVIE